MKGVTWCVDGKCDDSCNSFESEKSWDFVRFKIFSNVKSLNCGLLDHMVYWTFEQICNAHNSISKNRSNQDIIESLRSIQTQNSLKNTHHQKFFNKFHQTIQKITLHKCKYKFSYNTKWELEEGIKIFSLSIF